MNRLRDLCSKGQLQAYGPLTAKSIGLLIALADEVIE
jgi:hypothetical protein